MDRKTFIIPNNELAGGNQDNNSRVSLIVNQLHVQSVRRTSVDIEDFRLAQKIAEYIENPNDNRLQDMYEEAMLDAFLTGLATKRFSMVRNKRIRFLAENDKQVEKMEELISSYVFRKIREKIFYSKLFKKSGLEFLPGRELRFNDIPRKHIKTHLKVVSEEQDGGGKHWDYENLWNLWVIESSTEDNNHAPPFALLIRRNFQALVFCRFHKNNHH